MASRMTDKASRSRWSGASIGPKQGFRNPSSLRLLQQCKRICPPRPTSLLKFCVSTTQEPTHDHPADTVDGFDERSP